jgi:hypothetical protein
MKATIFASSRRVLAAATMAVTAGACNFVDSTTSNPNSVPNAALDQLFTGIQVNSYFLAEGQLSRMSAMWTQQMAGTDRQFASLDIYELKEDDADDEFNTIYTGGGLIDLLLAKKLATDASRNAYLGILQIHEAYLIGMAASVWGDIPYTQAGDPAIGQPELDLQEEVYADVQALLDQAINNLAATTGGPGANDFAFGGDRTRWIAVAHTLKARFYMHWVEAQSTPAGQTACGGNCLQKALASAQLGIASSAGNWNAQHSAAATENNLWYQFLRDRSGYISGGHYLVNLLKTRNDPRLALYYSHGSGPNASVYVGSPPGAPSGDPGTTASSLSETGYGAPDFDPPIVSCAERNFIIAEAQFRLNNEAAARSGLNDGVTCQEQGLNIDIPAIPSLSGAALLAEIMTQKHIAQFLNIDAWSDFKRTCLPVLVSNAQVRTADMPGRVFYGQQERQTNPNLPVPDQQPERNRNDPQPCT